MNKNEEPEGNPPLDESQDDAIPVGPAEVFQCTVGENDKIGVQVFASAVNGERRGAVEIIEWGDLCESVCSLIHSAEEHGEAARVSKVLLTSPGLRRLAAALLNAADTVDEGDKQ